MNQRISELLLTIHNALAELSGLLKRDDMPDIEMTQVFSDEDALAQLQA